MLYHKTKDILLVKEKLGYRNINNTLIYTHIVDFSENNGFYSATAKTVDEAKNLPIPDYVLDMHTSNCSLTNHWSFLIIGALTHECMTND